MVSCDWWGEAGGVGEGWCDVRGVVTVVAPSRQPTPPAQLSPAARRRPRTPPPRCRPYPSGCRSAVPAPCQARGLDSVCRRGVASLAKGKEAGAASGGAAACGVGVRGVPHAADARWPPPPREHLPSRSLSPQSHLPALSTPPLFRHVCTPSVASSVRHPSPAPREATINRGRAPPSGVGRVARQVRTSEPTWAAMACAGRALWPARTGVELPGAGAWCSPAAGPASVCSVELWVGARRPQQPTPHKRPWPAVPTPPPGAASPPAPPRPPPPPKTLPCQTCRPPPMPARRCPVWTGLSLLRRRPCRRCA